MLHNQYQRGYKHFNNALALASGCGKAPGVIVVVNL
jgi:hypothetical protein